MPVEHLEWAVRYALEIPKVTSLNIGVQDAEQVRHNLAMIRRFEPLTEADKAKVAALDRELAAEWGPQFGLTTEPVAFRHAARAQTA
jgi:predicted aldo/keto reductase-like oxidoreductase